MKYYNEYVQILKEELRPAMGCTEPIAVSYAASLAKKYLKENPKVIDVYVSGNILKNVKSVVVPNTKGLRGIKAATSIGIVAGNPDLELQCISKVTDQDIEKCSQYLNDTEINVLLSKSDFIFDIHMFAYNNEDVCEIRIVENHTNVVLIKYNNEIIFKRDITGTKKTDLVDRTILNVCDIVKFADLVNIEDVNDLINQQIEYNTKISDEGLKNNYGANIGKTLLASNPNDLNTRLKARAAAGSDARMNGCNMPVMINSGSGNQGMTCSLPVIEYASIKGIEESKLIRALVLSNLLTIHIKTGIGTLSAYCGVIAAGCAAGCAISYLEGADEKTIAHTLVNSLAIASGVICDGAKASCAAKIAIAVEAGILGYNMYKNGNQFYGGDGIVQKGVENTIKNIGRLASNGMKSTDEEIISIMIRNNC
jgi:L-cysteine desulfidase